MSEKPSETKNAVCHAVLVGGVWCVCPRVIRVQVVMMGERSVVGRKAGRRA